MAKATRPGGEMASRPLHFFWIVDCSGSMTGPKIGSVNFAIRESLPAMQDVARENPEAEILIRVLTFSSGARWHIGSPVRVDDFKWTDLAADGVTDMGQAMELLAEALTLEAMGERALPPVLVLLTDGQPTDNFTGGLKKLFANNWAKKAVRIGIAIGDDADLDVLTQFIAHPEFKPLVASNAPTLTKYIKWASTAVAGSVSKPASTIRGDTTPAGNVPLPAPPVPIPSKDVPADDVW